MTLERSDWVYIGGAAAGGILLGALMKGFLGSAPEPIHTGLARTYVPDKGGDPISVLVWAVPKDGYVLTFTKSDGQSAFPDMKMQPFTSPLTATMWADGVMADLSYTGTTDWAPMVNEAAEIRAAERGYKPAIAGRRKRR